MTVSRAAVVSHSAPAAASLGTKVMDFCDLGRLKEKAHNEKQW